MLFQNNDRVVFAGDSVTDMGRSRPVGEGNDESLGRSYVSIINNFLNAVYPELKIRITNMGVSGNTSRDLLARFDNDVCSLQPDWVSVCIGINDVWRQFDSPAIAEAAVDIDEYETNLIAMIEKVKDRVKGIFILSPYYIEPCRNDEMRAKMDEYVAVCKRLSEKYGCRFIDFQKLYEDYCAYRHSAFTAWDRVHPNQVGATLMALKFLNAIEFDFNHFNKFLTD